MADTLRKDSSKTDLDELKTFTTCFDMTRKIESFLEDNGLEKDEVIIELSYEDRDGTPVVEYEVQANPLVAKCIERYPCTQGELVVQGATSSEFEEHYLSHWEHELVEGSFEESETVFYRDL